MAKYVLVEFDDDEDADAFAAMVSPSDVASMRVRGVFKKPTLFCDCPKPSEKNSRGAKWGWWLCRNPGCGKPQRGMGQSPTNLIDPEDRKRQIGRKIFFTIREGD